MFSLLPYTACHSHNITGTVIDDYHGGLQLLTTAGIGNFIDIVVDSVYLVLHPFINGGIDVIAGLLDLLHHHLTGSGIPLEACLLGQHFGNIFQNRIAKVGVYRLGVILLHGGLGVTIGAAVGFALFFIGLYHTSVTAVLIFTGCQPVFLGDTGLQHQLLSNGCLIFLFFQPAVLTHCPQNVFFPLLVVIEVLIGIVIGGRVGDTDQTGAFCGCQQFQFLAEIGFCCAADTSAALTQVNAVQVHLHNGILVIPLFQLQSPEDFQNLTLHSYIVSSFIFKQQQVFN